jgi:arabinofuranosyltransferase
MPAGMETTPRAPERDHTWERLLFFATLGWFSYLFFANAWVGDDGYITLRTVDNFVNGYGLRWNVNERVQVFTHPLWMLLCAAVYFFTREAYYSVVVLSYVVCCAAFVMYRRALPTGQRWKAAALITILSVSKTFMDFSSSGLENCLGAFWAVSS